MQRYPNIFQYCALRTKNISDIFDLTKNTQFFCKPLYFGRDLRYNERINIRKIRIFRLPSKRKNGCSGYYPPDKAEERRVRRTQVFTMKTLGYYNGKFGPLDEMTVPMNDRVSYFGDGVYDATYSRNYVIYALDEHIDRFYNSAALLKIKIPHTKDEMKALLCDMVKKLDDDEQFVYWQVTRGTGMRNHAFPAGSVPANIWITLKPAKVKDTYQKIKLITLEDTRFLHCNIKTLNLLPSVMAAQKTAEAGCDEAVFHRGDRVTECAHSNVHIIRDGVFVTAPTDHLILPGIARAHLIKTAKQLGYAVDETPYTLDDLMNADEVIVSSSGSFCLAASEVDGKKVGGRAPEMLKALQDALVADYIEKTNV